MIEKTTGPLTVLFFENLLCHPGISHFVSTRGSGYSKPPFDFLNLGFHVGDSPDDVLKNRRRLAGALEMSLAQFTIAQQVHSGAVSIISKELGGKGCRNHEEAVGDTDAMVTDVPGICLMILVADCVPILFFDPSKRVIGAAHAGWRGTIQCIAQNTVMAMERAFGSLPEDIVVGIGPSIGPCCYRVGPDVISRFRKAFHGTEKLILNPSPHGEGYLDLWQANIKQLLKIGVKREHIELAGICTCHRPDLFFSYRQQQGTTGRFAAGIMLVSF